MLGQPKPGGSGTSNAADGTAPTPGVPSTPGSGELKPQAATPESHQDGEGGRVRLAIRVVVTGFAAVGFLVAGFSISPAEVGVPSARAGSIVLLTD